MHALVLPRRGAKLQKVCLEVRFGLTMSCGRNFTYYIVRLFSFYHSFELELHGKNEGAGLHERKPLVPNLKVSGQPMTSEVSSNTRRGHSEMTILGML